MPLERNFQLTELLPTIKQLGADLQLTKPENVYDKWKGINEATVDVSLLDVEFN